ncbi:MAG: glutaredoxin family protein [Bacteroidales bacterium]
MKKITVFYQPMCPFCKNAFGYIRELTAENESFREIEWEQIDELKEPELADTFDYYYVPSFFVDGKKIHEGGIYKEEVRALIQSVIDGTEFRVEES